MQVHEKKMCTKTNLTFYGGAGEGKQTFNWYQFQDIHLVCIFSDFFEWEPRFVLQSANKCKDTFCCAVCG